MNFGYFWIAKLQVKLFLSFLSLYFSNFSTWTLYMEHCTDKIVSGCRLAVYRTRINVWNVHGFFSTARLWPLYLQASHTHSEKKGRRKGQCLSQENKSTPRNCTADWGLTGQICVTWPPPAGKWKGGGCQHTRLSRPLLHCLPQTHISSVIKKIIIEVIELK